MSDDFLDESAGERRYLERIGAAILTAQRTPSVPEVEPENRRAFEDRVAYHQADGQHLERAEARAVEDLIAPARHQAVEQELSLLDQLGQMLPVGDGRRRTVVTYRAVLESARQDRTLRAGDISGAVAKLAMRWGIPLDGVTPTR